ncbi:MAG TPA: hypothetical protein VEK80_12235 [Kribbellaceae bacterium]|nr:hypothetical protein [Kribbellaceae bacterium]
MDHDRCVGNPANVVVSALATDNARTRAVLATFPVITVDVLASLAIAGIGFLVFEGFLVNQVSVLSWHHVADIWRLVGLVLAVELGLLYRVVGVSLPQVGYGE